MVIKETCLRYHHSSAWWRRKQLWFHLSVKTAFKSSG